MGMRSRCVVSGTSTSIGHVRTARRVESVATGASIGLRADANGVPVNAFARSLTPGVWNGEGIDALDGGSE
jgi:hypothetical protein